MSLKKQLEDILNNLNKTYQKLNYNKETLNQQSDNVKDQIKNNIIMQIDALNQRKQWLLNQLELVKSDKLESIQRKQEAIKCSISNIQKLLIDPPKYGNSQIKESFDSINGLMSEETRPFIAFRSDPALLREMISQYGVILKQYCGHFADPTRPSISLPSVVEEEDDEDSLTLSKKDESSKNDESNALRVTTFPVNSSIVRAWLMTTNEFVNNMEPEPDLPKSDGDSFIRVDSMDYSESNSQKNVSQINNVDEEKKVWLSSNGKTSIKSDYSDILRPFIDIQKQSNSFWLLEPGAIEDGKEVDHYDLVKKACTIGSCKRFIDCCEKENCCSKLIDPDRPSWNKWLLDNNVFKLEQLNSQDSCKIEKTYFSDEFTKIIKSDNSIWLEAKKENLKSTLKRQNENNFGNKDDDIQQCPLGIKLAKTDLGGHISIFNESLEKWIGFGRDLEWKENKGRMFDAVNKSVEKMSLDEVDGAMQEGIQDGSRKWLVDRQA